jgi:predicted permease
MPSLGRDFYHAARRLAATPIFSGFAVLTLALGIGVTTGIYSAVRAILTPPSGLADVDRLVRITRTAGGSGPSMSVSWPDFQDFTSQQSAFDAIAGWRWTRATFAGAGRAEPAQMELISDGYFRALGLGVAQGRALGASDDLPGAPPVTIISDSAWQRLFNSAPDVIGQDIKLNGASFKVVGVARSDFKGLFNGGVVPTSFWIPFGAARTVPTIARETGFDPGDRDRAWIMLVARLAPGRSFEQADAEVAAISARINSAHPDYNPARPPKPWIVKRMADVPKVLGADQVVGPMTTALMIAVGLVLLVACTNLANLMLARAATRRQEFAVRLSLGASRLRLLRENMTESILLAAIGGLAGIGLAKVLMVAVLSSELEVARGLALQLQPRLDPAAILAALGAMSLALITAGLGPALYAARADVRQAVATDNLANASPRWRGRRYLIAVQVAVSVALVAIAGLCVAQVRNQGLQDLGVDFPRIAVVDVDFSQQQFEAPRVRQIVDAVLERLAARPEITSVSASSGLPYGVITPGATVSAEVGSSSVEFVAATPAIFRTLGVAIRRGRGIQPQDVAGSAPVVVLGERAAQLLFDTVDVVGRQVTIQRRQWVGEPQWPKQTATVVGVAAAAGHELRDGPQRRGIIYVPLTQQHEPRLTLVARSDGDPARIIAVMTEVLKATEPEAPVTQSLTGAALLAQDTLFFRVVAAIATVLGALAFVVALAGLYGVLSFLVAGRTREIGIRLAIGADDRRIRWHVVREGLSPVLIGLLLGLGFGAIIRMAMRPIFVRMVPAMDVSVIVTVSVLFVAAGLLACYLPARRASRVDPVIALRRS